MMCSKLILLICFQCIVTNFGVLGQAPDVGKIFIGTQGNRSDPTEYTFNSNYAINTGTQSIPFSAVVFSGADGTEVSKDDLIDVTCVNEFNGLTGYIQIDFDTVNLPPADAGGSVPWDFRATPTPIGRAAVVRCYALSVNILCPPTATAGQPQPEFCPETSMSDPITIRRTPAPVVSICEAVNQVPSFTSNTYSGTFQVVLSEEVRSSNVTVSCQQVDPQTLDYCQQPGVTCCQQTNDISVMQTTVPVGKTTATMSYQITRTVSQNTCVGVRCSATSNAQLPEGYLQYGPGRDSSSEGLFQTVTPQVYMEPQYLTVYNTSFQSLLYLDASADVAFQCQASVVSTLEEALGRTVPANIDCNFIFANATTTNTVTTATTPDPITTPDANATTGNSTLAPVTTPLPTPPVDPSSPWITVDNSFIVTSEDKFYMVRTSRELVTIAAVQEIVVTTCCSTVTDVNSAYRDLKVASVTVANLVPRMNTTGGVTTGEPGDERFVVNPAYREVAPCPCDLTYQACDINCCCDAECTDAEKETFSGCIQGRPGGLDPAPDLHRCTSDHFPKEDWFPFMCVEFETNAFLGRFYTNTAKLSSATEISNKIYTYRETEPRFSDLAVINGYTDGSHVLTISSQGGAGNLPLPQHTTSGHCLDSAPVQFLRDTESTCTRTLTQATCSDLTPFSAHSYVEPSLLHSAACLRSFAVSSTGRSLQDETQRVNVQVNYYCASTSAAYVKTTTSSFSDLVSPGTVYSFPPGLENVNCTDLCGADTNSACLNYNQGKDESSATSLPLRCTGDNGFVLHSVPSYNPSTRLCDNVVLEVRYNFTWAGQTITGLTADVIVGSVAIPAGGEASVSQKFSAAFLHDYSGASNQTDNYQNLNTAYQRAGRPGYDYGKPVATGCQTTNATSGSSPVDQSQVNQMAVFSPGIDGLCQNAKRRSLTFGDDLQASCVLRLAFNDINSCDSLKTLVLNHLNVLMPANVIGRLGYNSPDADNMWINILREDPFPSTDLDTTTTPDPNATVATTVPPTTPENVTFNPLSVRGGVCRNIASGIHLEILYAETGRNNRYPVLEIVGAAVRYTVSNWSMSCVGPNSGRCESNSPLTQSFLVTSSVQYTRVSPTMPQKPILFYQIHNKGKCQSDTCYRFFEDFDTSTCHYDTCWHELFYPLTPSYQGEEGVKYTRGFSLLFVVFILGYVSVAKPWK